MKINILDAEIPYSVFKEIRSFCVDGCIDTEAVTNLLKSNRAKKDWAKWQEEQNAVEPDDGSMEYKKVMDLIDSAKLTIRNYADLAEAPDVFTGLMESLTKNEYEEARENAIKEINKILAEIDSLYSKARDYEWEENERKQRVGYAILHWMENDIREIRKWVKEV